MGLASLLSVLAMVLGLIASYVVPALPPSFGIIAVATLTYALTYVRRITRVAPTQ